MKIIYIHYANNLSGTLWKLSQPQNIHLAKSKTAKLFYWLWILFCLRFSGLMLLFVAISPITSNVHNQIQNREKTPFKTTNEREQKKVIASSVANLIHARASCFLSSLFGLLTRDDGKFNQVLLKSLDHQWHCQSSFYGF